jgi:hypothetical protein
MLHCLESILFFTWIVEDLLLSFVLSILANDNEIHGHYGSDDVHLL